MDIEARLARVEALVARLLAAQPRLTAGGDPPAPDAASAVPGPDQGPDGPHHVLGDLAVLLGGLAGPEGWAVAMGASGPGHRVVALRRLGPGEAPGLDVRRVASVCQALASEPRLGLLRELFSGERGAADLMRAAGVDRGQLYHHLRDLFVEGLVEQPERGRYRLTVQGRTVFLLATFLPAAARHEWPSENGGGVPAAAPPIE